IIYIYSSTSIFLSSSSLFLLLRPPPISTLFPYTTLFRSINQRRADAERACFHFFAHDLAHLVELLRRRSNSTRCARSCAKKWKRSEEHTSELQSRSDLVCRLLLEKKHKITVHRYSNLVRS